MKDLIPFKGWVPAVFVSGVMSAWMDRPNNQKEECCDEYTPDFITEHFEATRNAVRTTRFSECHCGGMQ